MDTYTLHTRYMVAITRMGDCILYLFRFDMYTMLLNTLTYCHRRPYNLVIRHFFHQ